MNNITLIDSILGEHKIKIQKFQKLEEAVNDFEIAAGLDKALGTLLPGRFDSKQDIRNLQELLEAIEQWLKTHFEREEETFFTAFKNYKDKKLISDCQDLLRDHEGLKLRLAQERNLVTSLIDGNLSVNLWQATAYDMRAHISNTRRLVEGHAATEEKLLLQLRGQLAEAQVISS